MAPAAPTVTGMETTTESSSASVTTQFPMATGATANRATYMELPREFSGGTLVGETVAQLAPVAVIWSVFGTVAVSVSGMAAGDANSSVDGVAENGPAWAGSSGSAGVVRSLQAKRAALSIHKEGRQTAGGPHGTVPRRVVMNIEPMRRN
jgi:hypothetical protein